MSEKAPNSGARIFDYRKKILKLLYAKISIDHFLMILNWPNWISSDCARQDPSRHLSLILPRTWRETVTPTCSLKTFSERETLSSNYLSPAPRFEVLSNNSRAFQNIYSSSVFRIGLSRKNSSENSRVKSSARTEKWLAALNMLLSSRWCKNAAKALIANYNCSFFWQLLMTPVRTERHVFSCQF